MIRSVPAAVGAAATVGVGVVAGAQAVNNKLIAKKVITNLYFIRVASTEFLLPIIRISAKTPSV
jgi:hypothetical protein